MFQEGKIVKRWRSARFQEGNPFMFCLEEGNSLRGLKPRRTLAIKDGKND
jgi:hypothetical protein